MANTHRDNDSPTLRDPSAWKTGDEPMTTAQRSYLETLAREAGQNFDPNIELTKAEAALRIEELQMKTGRAGSDS